MINDEALTMRIERGIADERSAFADGMAAAFPASKAGWIPVAGGRAVFTGRGFFSNRALGMGVGCAVGEKEIEEVESFYRERAVLPSIEIASTVARPFIDLLVERGYRMVRFHNIYAQSLPKQPTAVSCPAETHEVSDDASTHLWSTVLLDGFGYAEEADRARVSRWNLMLRSLPGLTAFLATIDDQPVASASVLQVGDCAVLGGATTLPPYRRRGVQQALIRARLAWATQAGCTLALVTADPGSTSGRNAERTGFRLANTHVAMRREPWKARAGDSRPSPS